ncbi:MAG: hypothetical protein IOB85_10090 [Methylobacterium sp.]|jgi:hypothetical protein|nr:hypothetical protein [Methylobacterium sp.]MCA3676846.1 hypothetical protein [Methylobacterium sp.]MCA3681282.1 hypothetical protein [Methylobacterium sp.]MCA3682614.1 hypothetical protein [Methylobacterium sp.]MCA3687744.1 hypothetical protein [Methylobacterium sp.]
MKRARFTEEPIIAVLKEHEAGAKTADLAAKDDRLRNPDQLRRSPVATPAPHGVKNTSRL